MENPVIAIIGGTGKEGTGLALRWAAAGYKILIGSRYEEKAKQAAESINERLGIKSVQGMDNTSAVNTANVCVLTVVHSAHQQALNSVKDFLHGKILIDATARIDFHDPKPPMPPSAAEQAQELLGPTVRVVAAFQNIPAKSLTKAINQPVDADVFVCADDIQAAEQVIHLANVAGMRGFYAGTLTNAFVVEGLTAILVSVNKYYGVKSARIKISGIDDKTLLDES
jgi:hypothetical protein